MCNSWLRDGINSWRRDGAHFSRAADVNVTSVAALGPFCVKILQLWTPLRAWIRHSWSCTAWCAQQSCPSVLLSHLGSAGGCWAKFPLLAQEYPHPRGTVDSSCLVSCQLTPPAAQAAILPPAQLLQGYFSLLTPNPSFLRIWNFPINETSWFHSSLLQKCFLLRISSLSLKSTVKKCLFKAFFAF